jgi:hypothetical protein
MIAGNFCLIGGAVNARLPGSMISRKQDKPICSFISVWWKIAGCASRGVTKRIAARVGGVYLFLNQEYTVAANGHCQGLRPDRELSCWSTACSVPMGISSFLAPTRCLSRFKFGWRWFFSLDLPWRPRSLPRSISPKKAPSPYPRTRFPGWRRPAV